ncbi:IS3 family transposase [Streptomyces castrisilvae]|uniref:IS3 family transposase n=1 Tax=Streptomyces castrisilvae TaxID=3033811 RepID=UPI003531D3C0
MDGISHQTRGGSPSHPKLRDQGHMVNRKRVARIMREREIVGVARRKPRSVNGWTSRHKTEEPGPDGSLHPRLDLPLCPICWAPVSASLGRDPPLGSPRKRGVDLVFLRHLVGRNRVPGRIDCGLILGDLFLFDLLLHGLRTGR